MTSLYNLSKELEAINSTLFYQEGEISPELEKQLDILNLELTDKMQGLRKWLAILDGDDISINKEISRLQHILMQRNRLKERLKTYIKESMERADISKIDTPIGSFILAKNPASIEVIVKEKVPEQFLRTIPEIKEPDKKLIKAAFDSGHDVPGCKLVTDKKHLIVK